jgi:hypothetical protein
MLKQHEELRRQSLEKLKIIRSEYGQNQKGKIIESIQTKEMLRNSWRRIRQALNPKQRSGLKHIDIPDKDEQGNPTDDPSKATTWKTITDPETIELKLFERNINHFGQAEGTAFTSDEFKAVDRLIRGDYDLSQLPIHSEATRKMFETLSNKKNLPKIKETIDFYSFKEAIRKLSESTSTLPSGQHLGQYKCLMIDDTCYEQYNNEHKDPSEKILKVYYHLAMAALRTGNSLERWQTSITTILEKQPGCSRINKLWVIHLYEADYNLILKIIWAGRLVWNAQDHTRINEGQAGSRPGRNAIDVVLQKEMKNLYCRLTRAGYGNHGQLCEELL